MTIALTMETGGASGIPVLQFRRVGVKEAQQRCPVCRADLNPTARYCGGCGYAVAPTATNHDDGDNDGAPSLVGQEVAGRYRITGKLGEGGMGAVYRAEQISLKRQIALKVLKPELSARPGLVRRFNAEAELAAKLNHPNTVTLYDFGQDQDGSLFIAMEFIDGRSLRELLIKEGPQPTQRIAAIGAQICSSLADAHASGIVHRDLKPDNVMLSKRGKKRDVVTVLDFGIAKLRDEEGNITQQPMTRVGDMLGTPQYMAPEQIRGERVDARTDVYALGVILYELATARLPFNAKSVMALLSMHLTDAPIPPHHRRPDLSIDPNLERLVMRCLAKHPAERPESMDAVEDELTRLMAIAGPISGHAGMAPYAIGQGGTGPGHPATGHPATGHPATGHPATGHPATGHPATGHGGRPDTGPAQPFTPVRDESAERRVSVAAPTPARQRTPNPAQHAPKKSRAGLWAFLAVILFGGGGAGAYFAFNPPAKSAEEKEEDAADRFMAEWANDSPSSGKDSLEDDLAELSNGVNELEDEVSSVAEYLYASGNSYNDPTYGYRVDLPATFEVLRGGYGEVVFSGFVFGNKMTIFTAVFSEAEVLSDRQVRKRLQEFADDSDLHLKSVREVQHDGHPALQGRLRATESGEEGDFILIQRSPFYYFAAIGGKPKTYQEQREFRRDFLETHFHPTAD